MTTAGAEQRDEFLSERVAGGMLPRVLNTFDMVAIFVSVVLFITNAAVIQSAGPAAFGWWIIGFLAFLIPGAIVTGQLGRMFPGEELDLFVDAEGVRPVLGFLRRVLRVVARRARHGRDGHGRAELPGLRLPVDDRRDQRAGAGPDHHRLHRVVGGARQPAPDGWASSSRSCSPPSSCSSPWSTTSPSRGWCSSPDSIRSCPLRWRR